MKDEQDLERVVWTDADFEAMGWHDATVHAIGLDEQGNSVRLLLDIDYIVRWVEPAPPAGHFTFLVAPATLVFENVSGVQGDLNAASASGVMLQIDDIECDEEDDAKGFSRSVRRWTIHGHNFDLSLLASGYRQHMRGKVLHVDAQTLGTHERGGISFDEPYAFS